MIKLIAAVGKNYEIGKDNKLLWDLKGDMKYFRETTSESTVVMGKNTFLSIGRPLPNRKNIVITKSEFDDVICMDDPKKILESDEDVFIIGGASIYEYFVPYADEIYLTEVDIECDADTYFPKFDKSLYTDEIVGQNREDDIEYTFHIYKRK